MKRNRKPQTTGFPQSRQQLKDWIDTDLRALENPGTSLVFRTSGYDVASTEIHALANHIGYGLREYNLANKLHAVAGEPLYAKQPDDVPALIATLKAIKAGL